MNLRVHFSSIFRLAIQDGERHVSRCNFLNGEPKAARPMLRDLINARIGFEQLSVLTTEPSKSLRRMLSSSGNPSIDNLAAIVHAICARLKVNLEAHSVAA